MTFDEKERAHLLKRYESLPDETRALCRLMAVLWVPAAVTSILLCASAAKLAAPEGGRWTPDRIRRCFKNDLPRGMFEPSLRRGEHRQLSILLRGSLWDEAVRRGEFNRFDQAVEKAMRVNSQADLEFRFSSKDVCARALRRALTLKDEPLLARCWNKLLSFRPNGEAFLEATLNPPDAGRLASLSPAAAERVFPPILYLSLEDPFAYQIAAQALFDYKEQTVPPRLELARIERLIMHGRMEEAQSRLKGFQDPEGFALRAVLALSLRGDEGEALALYEEGLKRMKGRESSPFYLSWMGMFYPLLLRRAGEGERKLKSSLKKIEYWGLEENMRPLAGPLRRLLGIDKLEDASPVEFSIESNGLVVFPGMLLLYWLGEDEEKVQAALPELISRFDELGMSFLSSELRALQGDSEGGALPPHPLKDILKREEEWERSLSALSSISGVPGAAGSTKRIVWEVDWYANEGGRVRNLNLTPIEQTLQKTGWSKGRNIALRRLATKAASIAGMTEQDLRAASAVRMVHSYYGSDYVLDDFKALASLAGHPLLFNSNPPHDRVEVTVSEPLLSVREEKRGYVLTLSPSPREGETTIVTEDGPGRLRVTQFESRHMNVARILGPSGLMIPSHAKDRIVQVLESLASIVTIHSDIEGVGGTAEVVDADARLCVQIQPDGVGLEVGAEVRPLGPGSVACRPGRGGASLFGALDGKRVQASRDLAAESEALFAFQAACPALAEGEQVGEESWRLSDPVLSLEFLSQLDAMGDAVTAEWPRGQAMKLVSGSIGQSSLNVSIRRTRDWFSLSGELQVREDLVLGMKTLFDAMREGRGRFIPLGNGEFLALTREFQRRLEALAALGEGRGPDGDLRLSPLAAGVAEDLLEGVGQLDASEDWRSRVSLIAEAEKLTPVLPSTFKGELRDYQLEGFQWLMRLAHWGAGACLADDMGLGKTIQALAVLAARGPLGPSLVVAPTSVSPNWMTEAERFAPTLRVKDFRHGDRAELLAHLEPMDLVLASYGLLQSEREMLQEVEWNVIVLDEAQAIKNMGTKRSSAAMKLKGAFRIATTGTPIENSLSELWNLFRFLNPGYLGSFESFWRRFGAPIEREMAQAAEGGEARPGRATEAGRGARSRLRQMIRPFILRRTKDQVLSELPTKTEITLKVDLKDEERAFYEALRRSAVEELSAVGEGPGEGRFQVLAALMRLRRACCSASLVNPDLSLPSAKLEAFADVLSELRGGGHKALVFSQFVDHLTILRAWLDKEEVPYQYLDGATPPEERKRRVAAFQAGDGDCFLISLKAGGTGLNLTAADYVIHMDPWWNPAVEEQASDRAHRIGQERPVTVYRLVARDTVEEKIVALHEWKRDLADGLLDDTGTAARLSVDELLKLIREP